MQKFQASVETLDRDIRKILDPNIRFKRDDVISTESGIYLNNKGVNVFADVTGECYFVIGDKKFPLKYPGNFIYQIQEKIKPSSTLRATRRALVPAKVKVRRAPRIKSEDVDAIKTTFIEEVNNLLFKYGLEGAALRGNGFADLLRNLESILAEINPLPEMTPQDAKTFTEARDAIVQLIDPWREKIRLVLKDDNVAEGSFDIPHLERIDQFIDQHAIATAPNSARGVD